MIRMPPSVSPRLYSIVALAFFAISGGFAQAPITADLSRIVADMNGSLGRGPFRVYRWDRFPSILIFDMVDFQTQNRMFSRLAFYLEKISFRGRLLTNAELEGKHGWNAHDYGAEGLAAFFNAAASADLTLNPEEYLLENITLREGILVRQGGTLTPGRAAFCRFAGNRRYTSAGFCSPTSPTMESFSLPRRIVDSVSLCGTPPAPMSAALWWHCFACSATIPPYRYLAVNEFQAYLLQQPSNMAGSYFKRVAALLQDPSNAPPIGRVLPQLLKSERRLETFLKDEVRYGRRRGLFDGDEWKMRRSSLRVALFIAVLLGAMTEAFAHPHVFIANTMRVVFDGHYLDHFEFQWVFDELFSSMLLTDFDRNHTGHFTAAEAAAIKKGAFDNLKNYHYFLAFSIDGRPIRLPQIEHFAPSISNGALVYTFSLAAATRYRRRESNILSASSSTTIPIMWLSIS